MICVYFHINPLKNEVFYVGIGTIKKPYVKYNRSIFWKNTVKKYGYIIDIIHKDLTWEEACIKEKFYINFIGRKDLGKGSLVNLTDGGDGIKNLAFESKQKISISNKGKIISLEQRKLMSISQIGKKQSIETINKRIKSLKGKKHSEQTKLKISIAHKGKKFSDETLEKMRIANKNMSIENRYKINEASKKPIVQYDLQNNFIKNWKSATDIQNELKINGGAISACCKNKRKSAGKFRWKYYKQ